MEAVLTKTNAVDYMSLWGSKTCPQVAFFFLGKQCGEGLIWIIL